MSARVRKEKSLLGIPPVDIDRRAKGVKFHPVRASAAGRTGFPGIDSLLPHSGMVARDGGADGKMSREKAQKAQKESLWASQAN
jgi:hypothetical protein